MAQAALTTETTRVRAKGTGARALLHSQPSWTIDVDDVQGLVLRGYGALSACAYLLLHVDDRHRARPFLRNLVGEIASGLPGEREIALQVAFTHAGFHALGLYDEALAGFSRPFIAGMVGPHKSRFLGDVAESAPEHWLWGGPTTPVVHAVMIVFASDSARLERKVAQLRQSYAACGLRELHRLSTGALTGREHFGFVDGISQPAIRGYHETASSLHAVQAGEFLLGYPNEYGQYTERPLLAPARDPAGRLPLDPEGSPRRDFGRNGSYLVFRQLRQDVPLFRRTLAALTQKPDGSLDPEAQARLAAKMVGRWPSGAPLVEAPYEDVYDKARSNEFRYHDADPHGLKCPLGAHVRRANPRDALAPKPGTDFSLAVNRRHRVLRRGRTYGEPLASSESDSADRGIMFVALNANLTRQFEFIQHSWLIDPRFNGLHDQADPIVSGAEGHRFSIPGTPVSRLCPDLPRFVTVAGGAYFFLPGLRALRFLSELTS